MAGLTTGVLTLAVGIPVVRQADPEPAAGRLAYKDARLPVAERVDDLMSRMSLDDKLGQMLQVERLELDTPADVATYRLGSLLSGGDSQPTPNTPTAWADMYDAFQRTALSTPLGIPLIYGVDAVHGHNGVYGATIFPHNIGLGATRNPALVERIGRATAEEVAGTGIDWSFAPCLCVARNDRWGRTYESFGEVPQLASSMSTLITGLQGRKLGDPASVLATAKHYVGDGGTRNGDDRGETSISEAELRAVHLPPFKAARGQGCRVRDDLLQQLRHREDACSQVPRHRRAQGRAGLRGFRHLRLHRRRPDRRQARCHPGRGHRRRERGRRHGDGPARLEGVPRDLAGRGRCRPDQPGARSTMRTGGS